MTRKSDLAERADELGLPHSRSTTIPELEKAIIEDEDRRRGATLDEVLRDAAKEVGFHEPIIDNVFGSDLIEMPVSDAYRAMENVVEIVVPAEAEVRVGVAVPDGSGPRRVGAGTVSASQETAGHSARTPHRTRSGDRYDHSAPAVPCDRREDHGRSEAATLDA